MPSDSPGPHQRLVALVNTSKTLLLSSRMPDVAPASVEVAAAPAHRPPLVQQHA